MNDVVLSCQGLEKHYRSGGQDISVLTSVDFNLQAREQVAVVGPSGGGKSTLLHSLAGLDKPSCGQVFWSGTDLYALSERARCELRNQHMGFIYQFHHLLPEFNTLDNVAMPLFIRGDSKKKAHNQAQYLLSALGLADKRLAPVQVLSGGERQRVAIARALVTEPRVILADEPTGNLDQENAQQVMQLLRNLSQTLGTAMLMVTHDLSLADSLDSILCLQSGQLKPNT